MKFIPYQWLRERARLLTGEPQPIEFTDRVVPVCVPAMTGDRCCVHQVKE
ncbi:hypothetical protein ACNKHL_03105 [Shigella flexneri]